MNKFEKLSSEQMNVVRGGKEEKPRVLYVTDNGDGTSTRHWSDGTTSTIENPQ